MEDEKRFTQSLTMRAALLGLVPFVVLLLNALGIEAQNATVETLVDALAAIVGGVATIGVIIGRWRASARLTK